MLFRLQNALMQIRTGMVMISDGKSKPELARLHLTMEVITLQRPEQVIAVSPTATMLSNQLSQPPQESKVIVSEYSYIFKLLLISNINI